MEEVFGWSALMKAGALALAVVVLWGFSRVLDVLGGVSFKRDVWPILVKSPDALSRYLGWRIFALAVLVGLIMSACSPAQAASLNGSGRFSDKYDRHIQAAASTWLPGQPWKLWKAQLYQESLLNPDAVSPVGAAGIAQFMPGTWDQVLREMGQNPMLVDRRLAGPAIEAGAYYMAKLQRAWSAPRPAEDRIKLAQASYNAGMGNILRSQQRCGNPAGYEPIMACLHLVTGRHAAETRGYAPSIFRWWALMEAGG